MNRESLFGNFRAKVVNNKDPKKFGRVEVWIPDIMPTVDDKIGIWARPANNPVGGRNIEGEKDHYYMGTSYIPSKGSWLFVFFEAGNINRPYYFGALDLENTPVLPENQVGANYQDKWTIFKSHYGRAIVVSDDPDDARVEVTGKKIKMAEPPTGDTGSVYTIDGNQTTILLDEREGKQKVLIRTVKGDFIHLDIDDRKLQAYFQSDILIKTDGNLLVTAKGNMEFKSTAGDVRISADAGYMDVSANADYREYAGGNKSSKSMNSQYIQAQSEIHELAGGDINTDAGRTRSDQCGIAEPAERAIPATIANPQGGRDT